MKTLVQLAAFVVFAAWLQRLEIARANERAYEAWYSEQNRLALKAIARFERYAFPIRQPTTLSEAKILDQDEPTHSPRRLFELQQQAIADRLEVALLTQPYPPAAAPR